ncbi:hypothetical protein GCK72_001772 [Caenorhabditis remanei]|uniref:PAN-3 domain-containing protein n=1 Tax=Caenorhabditis remanei TaxID=31234 RepID=A0A6A5HQM7_CAERE|nr:hypothetical protein GCK72_001772 [Caenorhabditis remanei]KAF1769955.1 hypothetical protein GCK72_001772 [Caenorhabditis remanei]
MVRTSYSIITFLLLLLGITNPETYKMIIIYGSPQSFTTYSNESLTFEECVNYCFESETCVAVYNPDVTTTVCQVFDLGKISKVKETNGGGAKVAMKMNSTDPLQCPLTAEENTFSTEMQNGQYNITPLNGIWTFSSRSCPLNFTMFERPLGFWCIGVIPVPNLLSQETGASLCSSVYGGILSGLQTLDEYNYIIGIVQPILEQVTETIKSYGTLGFWINGSRKPTCKQTVTSATCDGTNEFDFTDPLLSAYDGYVWGKDQPSGIGATDSNCIHFGFNTSTYQSVGVDDYKCTVANTTNAGFLGYICGVRPTIR